MQQTHSDYENNIIFIIHIYNSKESAKWRMLWGIKTSSLCSKVKYIKLSNNSGVIKTFGLSFIRKVKSFTIEALLLRFFSVGWLRMAFLKKLYNAQI